MSYTGHLSDNAIRLWVALFRNPSNLLSFGGEGAVMDMTPEGRDALDELLAIRAVAPSPPTDSRPGRECYRSGEIPLHAEVRLRTHLDHLAEETAFIAFQSKDGAREPAQ